MLFYMSCAILLAQLCKARTNLLGDMPQIGQPVQLTVISIIIVTLFDIEVVILSNFNKKSTGKLVLSSVLHYFFNV